MTIIIIFNLQLRWNNWNIAMIIVNTPKINSIDPKDRVLSNQQCATQLDECGQSMLFSKMTDTIFCCVVLQELSKDCLASKYHCLAWESKILFYDYPKWNRVFHWLYRLFIAAIHFNHKKSNQKPRILDITYPKFKKGEPTVRKQPEKADFGKHSDITILVDTPKDKCVVLIILLCNNKISRLLQTS